MADTVKLQKSYSALNEKIIKLFDESGVRRSITVPYVEGQAMADHVSSVGQAATEAGGLTNNLLLTAHHSDGKGWNSGDGHTVGYSADKLRTTLLPKDDENAKSAIKAAQTHLTNIEKLVGEDDPAVQTANSQLDLVKKTDGAGMSALDFGVLLTQIMYAPMQSVARAYSGAKDGGHAPHLRAPGPEDTQESQSQPAGESQEGGAPSDASQAPEAASAAPAAAPEGSAAPAPAAQA